jgi:hypothetical protein
MNNKRVLIVCAATLAVVAGVLWVLNQSSRSPDPQDDMAASNPGQPTAGVSASVLPGAQRMTISGLTPVEPGQQARLDAQRASVVEAARSGEHFERRTTLTPARPFDPVAYRRDPEAYLRVIEPGRIFQSAKPGPDVKPLEIVGDAELRMDARSSVSLSVRAEPGAPVTFHSSDGGGFENRLTTITVRADDQGLARARYLATPGTYADVHVTAASPMTSGRVLFVIEVDNPEMQPMALSEDQSQPRP